jgi:hypothetical protein
MRTDVTIRPRHVARRPAFLYRHSWLVCGLLIFLWAAIHYGRDIPLLSQSRGVVREHKPELLFSGSILFMPLSGDTCRQRLIDNATGQIRDNGLVDCATAKAETEQRWAARMALQRHAAVGASFATR